MYSDNSDFYPTPERLITKMIYKLKDRHSIESILEPSAGSGAITEYLKTADALRGRRTTIYAIEKDLRLQVILRGQKTNLIDTDFLKYAGGQHFDAIVANFPFSDGERHLLKAIEIMFSGQIVCLLNSETVRNPKTNNQRLLVQKLSSLDAEIEYLKEEFVNAERKTSVEVALIYIDIKKDVETSLFNNMKEERGCLHDLSEETSVSRIDDVYSLVKNYDITKEALVNQIVGFYEGYARVSNYIDLSVVGESCTEEKSLTKKMQSKINSVIKELKNRYWRDVLELRSVKRMLTSKKTEELASLSSLFTSMEFTEENVNIFISEIMGMYPKMIQDCILDVFDLFTEYGLKGSGWDECHRNVHYFNGWKSNSCYKVNRKVILPWMSEYCQFSKKVSLRYGVEHKLMDIEKVINYFSPVMCEGSIVETVRKSLSEGVNKKIETPLFLISIFKKGTMHIEFTDLQSLRWFNIEACKLKKFLPYDYSEKDYTDLSPSEREIVTSFESKSTYARILNKLPVLSIKQTGLLLESMA